MNDSTMKSCNVSIEKSNNTTVSEAVSAQVASQMKQPVSCGVAVVVVTTARLKVQMMGPEEEKGRGPHLEKEYFSW